MNRDFIAEAFFYATPQDVLLVAAQTSETKGEGSPVIVGSGDGHAFSISRQWLDTRLASPGGLRAVPNTEVGDRYRRHMGGMLSLLTRRHPEADFALCAESHSEGRRGLYAVKG